MESFSNYTGYYRHKSGDRKIRFKIWSLPDCPGGLTALHVAFIDNIQPPFYLMIESSYLNNTCVCDWFSVSVFPLASPLLSPPMR